MTARTPTDESGTGGDERRNTGSGTEFRGKGVGEMLRRAFVPPFAVRTSILLAAAFGLASPLFLIVLGAFRLWQARTWILLVGGALYLGQLYRNTPRTAKPRAVHSLGAGLLFVGAIASAVWCFRTHICMAGHMHHPPYSAWHYVGDAGWAAALVAACLWLWLVRSHVGIAVACLASFLLCYRFAFGSFGGMYPIPL
jgi:hypothetical protein